MMTNGDREGRIFLSHPHTNNGFFFLLTTKYLILYWKTSIKRLPENPEYAEMRLCGVIFHYNDVTERIAAVRFLSFPRAGSVM